MDLKVSEILAAKLQSNVTQVNNKPVQDFSFTLNKLDEAGLAARLGAFIEEIKVYGGKLSKHMDLSDMKKYRSLITEFINEVVTHSHQFTRENFLDRRGRHRVYGIVKLINKNIDELAQELLSSEKDNLKILEKIGQIEGLILDLFV
jgi:uncharacterized protein